MAKRLGGVAVAVAVFLGTAAMAADAAAAVLRVGSYNIHHGLGGDGVVDLDRIAEVIDGMDADVVGLQENDFTNARTGFVDQPAAVAEILSARTGGQWTSLPAPAIDYRGGQYGNAVIYDASRLTLLDYSVTGLPDPLGDGARSVANATFSLDGAEFQFLTTHLTHRNVESEGGSTVQLDSVNIIDSVVDDAIAAILTGDMNASIDPADDVSLATMQRLLELGWRIDSPVEGTTFVGGEAVIDYVLSNNGGLIGLTMLGSEVIQSALTSVASDHYPLVTEYEVDTAQVPAPAGLGLVALGGLAVVARRRGARG